TATAQIARRSELIIASLCEAVLIFIAGIAAWVTRQPMIFTSLGPNAFEMVETPHRKSAKPYKVLIGHLIGVAAGFAAMRLTGAWWVPPVSAGHIHIARVTAVSLGWFQDAAVIMAAITLMVAFGEPLRMWRGNWQRPE